MGLSTKNKEILFNPVNKNNPVIVQMLGICSALAVTVKLQPAIVMTLSVIAVVAFANVIVYVGLIMTNCILMGRLEAFALGNRPWESFLDGVGNGVGYGIILIAVAFFRELFGSGTLLGYQVIPQAFYDLGYVNNGLMIMPPMALILCALIIWIHRSRNKDLQEEN